VFKSCTSIGVPEAVHTHPAKVVKSCNAVLNSSCTKQPADAGEGTDDVDLVGWVMAGVQHIPRSEDVPVVRLLRQLTRHIDALLPHWTTKKAAAIALLAARAALAHAPCKCGVLWQASTCHGM
jgi:Copper amine oxidase, enzyme domain